MMTFAARVEAFVAMVPAGRVVTYGDVSGALAVGTPRGVGQVMARSVVPLPWWRVVRADGGLPPRLVGRAVGHWDEEGIGHSAGRCDLARHRLSVAEVWTILARAHPDVGRIGA